MGRAPQSRLHFLPGPLLPPRSPRPDRGRDPQMQCRPAGSDADPALHRAEQGIRRRRRRDHPDAQDPPPLCHREIRCRIGRLLQRRERDRAEHRNHLRGWPKIGAPIAARDRRCRRTLAAGRGVYAASRRSRRRGGVSQTMPDFEWQFTLVLLTNGIMIGLMYALIALGFVLIYKATDAINFAQGEFVMFAGFIAAGAADIAGFPFWVCALLAVGGMVAL